MNSNLTLITSDIYSAKEGFESVLSDSAINFEKEAAFAIQAITKNDYIFDVAIKNRQSVINAVKNIAAIGISLNPAKKQAYLVPRKKEICLDISYIGLMDLAMATGSILWGQAKIVRAKDVFELNNLDQLPTHRYNPFNKKDRGDIIGVYVVVKTHANDYLTHPMDLESVYEIRARSDSFKSGKGGPWLTDTEEMIKKTCVKQASKYWPKTDRLDNAINYLNTDGGEGITPERKEPEIDITPLVNAAVKTETDAEALQFWKENNGQLAKNPVAHAKLKEAISFHRVSLAEQIKSSINISPEVISEQQMNEFVSDFDDYQEAKS